ncbi:hypothetical protein [Methanosarcina mazei]|jgi:hypothetical protein|nr:hypothetical protein [Methanosarcina mazei]
MDSASLIPGPDKKYAYEINNSKWFYLLYKLGKDYRIHGKVKPAT